MTSDYAQINLQGPRSREVLQSVTTTDVSNEAIPFRAARQITIGSADVLCVRITYLGELGYELYVPAADAVHVHDLLVGAGQPLGLRHAGLKALSLRLEKGYRDYGHDIDNTDGPLEAGFGYATRFEKPGGFVGQRGGAGPTWGRAAAPPARVGATARPPTAAVPRRGRTPRRPTGRLCAGRLVRPHGRWRRGAGHDRGPRWADHVGHAGGGQVDGRGQRTRTWRSLRCARSTTPPTPESKPDRRMAMG